MAFLAQLVAFMMQWLLTMGGKAAYEWTNDYIEKQAQKKRAKENLKKYKEAVKKGNDDDTLEKERDLING